jgi:hypothetical protein
MAESHQPPLISALPPSRAQQCAALVAALCLLALFFGVLPFAHVQLAKIEAFIPIVASVMFLTDSILLTRLERFARNNLRACHHQ